MVTNESEYESAEYKVLLSEGKFEVREYPDLMLVATGTDRLSSDSSGSFMQLFRYISGANESKQKIAMTTPVFMQRQAAGANDTSLLVQMGFVIPKEVAAGGAPKPEAPQVELRQRRGGRFAVVRFSGVMNSRLVEEHAVQLREWMKLNGLVADEDAGGGPETAGYDSPFTPPARRRNEVLIRLKAAQ